MIIKNSHTNEESVKALLALPDPSNNHEVSEEPEAPYWQRTKQDEFDSLIKNNTWDLVPLSANRKAIISK